MADEMADYLAIPEALAGCWTWGQVEAWCLRACGGRRTEADCRIAETHRENRWGPVSGCPAATSQEYRKSLRLPFSLLADTRIDNQTLVADKFTGFYGAMPCGLKK